MSSQADRLHHVDIFRGLAAFAVAWFHFTQNGPTDYPDAGFIGNLITASGSKGWLGVEVFFVISGFILPYTMVKGGYSIGDFYVFVKKRIIRLDPPYFAAIAIFLGPWWISSLRPGFAGEPLTFEPIRLLLHLGYLNAFFDYEWYNPVFWTLAIEFQFYLFLALYFPILFSENKVLRVLSFLAIVAAPLLIPVGKSVVLHYFGLFALGILAAHYVLENINVSVYLVGSFLVAGIIVIVNSWWVSGVALASALAIAFVRLPDISPLTWLGKVSYSLYLIHIPIGGRVIRLGKLFADTLAGQIFALLSAVAVSLAASWVLYRLVEQPSQRLSSSIQYKQTLATASVSEDRD